jgi:hypothetical protein
MHVQNSDAGLQKMALFLKVAAYAFLVSMFFRNLSNTVVDLDLWHQMALIRESLHLGYIPLRDPFAYTPTIFPSVHHEWGAGAIAYFMAVHLGGTGILALKYLLALSIVFFCFMCIKRRSVSVEVLIFSAPVGIMLMQGGFASTRAQMYSYAFTACLLWFFELDKNENRRWLIVWIPLFIIWVNLHAGFLVGIGLLGAFGLERLLQRKPHTHLILTGVLMTGLIALNPYGFDYYPHLWHAMTMSRSYIREWYPIWRDLDLFQVSLFVTSLILLIYSINKIGIRNAHGLAVLLTVTLASIFCRRLVFFYGIVWTIYVPSYLQKTPLRNVMIALCKRFSIILILVLSLATVATFVRTVSFSPWKLLVPSDHIKKYGDHPIYPVGPVEYLSEIAFKGNLMVYFDWGSYVLWKLHPNVRVSMDSRYEAAYPEWLVDENIQFYWAKEGWQHILTAYPTDLVLVYKGLPLGEAMPQQSEWKKVFTDDVFELYARPGLTMPVVNRTGRSFTGVFP